MGFQTAEMKNIFSDRTLADFDVKAVFANLTNRIYDADAKRGKSVIIPTLGSITLRPYGDAISGSAMVKSRYDTTTQSLLIDQQYYSDTPVDDLEQLWGSADTLTKLINVVSNEVVDKIDTTIAALQSTITYSGSVGGTAITNVSGAYDAIVDIGTALKNNGVPVHQGECFVVVPPEISAVLMKDPRFVNHLDYLNNGLIDGGKINNMKVYESANAPISGSGHWIIAGHPDAWALAYGKVDTRFVEDQDLWGNLYQTMLVFGTKIIQPTGLYKQGMHVSL